jgi:hypothetical protein
MVEAPRREPERTPRCDFLMDIAGVLASHVVVCRASVELWPCGSATPSGMIPVARWSDGPIRRVGRRLFGSRSFAGVDASPFALRKQSLVTVFSTKGSATKAVHDYIAHRLLFDHNINCHGRTRAPDQGLVVDLSNHASRARIRASRRKTTTEPSSLNRPTQRARFPATQRMLAIISN